MFDFNRTLEFRPFPNFFNSARPVLRYAHGLWLEDDGEYDIAFVGNARSSDLDTYGFPCAMNIEIPLYENALCWFGCYMERGRKGLDKGWHRSGLNFGLNLERYRLDALVNHPNRQVYREASNKCCDLFGCANGRPIEYRPDNKYFAAGLIRFADTKECFKWPDNIVCMYCNIPLDQEKIRKDAIKDFTKQKAIEEQRMINNVISKLDNFERRTNR